MPRLRVPLEEKGPTASEDGSGAIADSTPGLLAAITLKLEEINKYLVDQNNNIDDLRQQLKPGDDNAHAAVGGGARDTPAGN